MERRHFIMNGMSFLTLAGTGMPLSLVVNSGNRISNQQVPFQIKEFQMMDKL